LNILKIKSSSLGVNQRSTCPCFIWYVCLCMWV